MLKLNVDRCEREHDEKDKILDEKDKILDFNLVNLTLYRQATF